MKIIGKTTIHPILFYSGKISGYITWIGLALSLFQIINITNRKIIILQYLSIIILAFGLVISMLSIFYLGSSTRLGLPNENTLFKKNGLYKISRNPMYIGFNFVTISSIIFHLNVIIGIMGVYSIIIYHYIILGEEKFMEEKYGDEYRNYKGKVQRYL